MLLYMDLPSLTAATIVLKLSSASTISEASFATWKEDTNHFQQVPKENVI